jgi:phosphoserine phosphatase
VIVAKHSGDHERVADCNSNIARGLQMSTELFHMHRRRFLGAVAFASAALSIQRVAFAAADPLPSWNEGPNKQSIIAFVNAVTDDSKSTFVPPEGRIATFDQDGTLWVEHPVYSQVQYIFHRVPALVEANPKLKDKEPFRTVLSGDHKAFAALSMHDLEVLAVAALTGMTTDQFQTEAKAWLAGARDPRWKQPFTELTYVPMLELLTYLRSNGFQTFIVTGGGQDFVRIYSSEAYDIPAYQVVGTAGEAKYTYDANGKPILIKEPKLLLNDNNAGKPEGIHLMIGKRPILAFGNSSGDEEMLEYTFSGDGSRMAVLLLHDDADREYAYGPAQQLPPTHVGEFPQTLYDRAIKDGWHVVSMKNDWKQIFKFED